MADSRPLFLLHGALGAAEQFEPLLPLLGEGPALHVMNFGGHGGEPIPPDGFTIAGFAAQVLERMDRESIDKADIFGYSMGGYVGLYLARHYPDRVGRLFTVATKFRWTEESAARETRMLDPVKIEEKVPQFAADLKRRHAPLEWSDVLSATAGMMLELGRLNAVTLQDLTEIEHPVRVGVGDHDQMVGIDETIEMYRQLKNGELVILPGTPHPIEKISTARLSHEIRDFFCR